MAGAVGSLVPQYEEDEEEELEQGVSEAGVAAAAAGSGAKISVNLPSLCVAPYVPEKHDASRHRAVASTTKELVYNAKYEEMFTPERGPENPFKTESQKAAKNTVTGFVEPAHISQFRFENERRTFETYGYARDPSASLPAPEFFVGENAKHGKAKGGSVFDNTKTGGEKRKRIRNMDPGDVEGYTGPWGHYVDETRVSKPDEKTMAEMEEFQRKRKKLAKKTKDEKFEERSILHIKEAKDYQGRTFMQAPQDVGVNLRADAVPDRCFVPKKQVHTYKGHTKGVMAIRWFPATAHLLLSGAMDSKIKLWHVYGGRPLIRSYFGHNMAVRDLCFNNSGTEFLSASFDRYIKLWDTETGQCKERFHTGKVPFCVKFNPDEDKQHFFLSGMADKKVIQWDTRSGEIVQEYDRHLGAVNTITFFDENRRFCTTSDDKSLRIWEWEIPVDTKVIQDSGLHSMPAATMAPNKKWLACQALDNRVMLFQIIDDKLRFAKKRAFKGHMVAGYACAVDFSPDMSFLVSGDGEGKAVVWDWKTHRVAAKWKAHDNVCIGVLWHPHEASKIATCGWDGLIKMWD